jgi:hypothetical protein
MEISSCCISKSSFENNSSSTFSLFYAKKAFRLPCEVCALVWYLPSRAELTPHRVPGEVWGKSLLIDIDVSCRHVQRPPVKHSSRTPLTSLLNSFEQTGRRNGGLAGKSLVGLGLRNELIGKPENGI